MCHKQVLLVVVLVISITVLTRPATATEYVVGDADGWRPGVDYTAWAMGKQFKVGDTLVFNYAKGKHNVYNVTGPDFKTCAVSTTSLLRDSGADAVTLKAEGRRWYLCGVAGHCQGGQKLVITVLPAAAPSPMPFWPPTLSPSPPAPTPVPPPASAGALPTAFPSVALAAAAAALVAVAVAAVA